MAPDINTTPFRGIEGKEFKLCLDKLQQKYSDIDICQSLFKDEHLHSKIFSVFISCSKSMDAIALYIRHGPSLFIRKRGIQHFDKALTDPEHWESAWRAVGGTGGLVDIFAKISVKEVKALARAIGYCNRPKYNIKAREEAVEELLCALLPSHYPESKLQSHEKRPIQNHYAQMLPACSNEFLEKLLDDKDQSNPLYKRLPLKRLFWTHSDLVQKLDPNHRSLDRFVYSLSPKDTPIPELSDSMAFKTTVLQLRLKNINDDEFWPSTANEADILFSLLEKARWKRLPEAELHDIIMLGMRLLEAKPELRRSFQSEWLSSRSEDMWSKLMTRWGKAPDIYEDVLVLALRLGLGGSLKRIGIDFPKLTRSLHTYPESRWPLLRLHCLHVPQEGVDLDTADDFQLLAKQFWLTDIFYQLSKDHAVRLLKGLRNANPEYSFLRGARNSILLNQDITTQRNFNVILLLTILQRDLKDTQRKAETGVDTLRKKAATSREQSDRAELAKAASDYAIASGMLDLYAETVTWQQRYVRDPLTSKVVFGSWAVMTSEGIELLSGIPQPLSEDIEMADIASRVQKANGILMTFHKTMLMAEREPSFQQQDWTHLTSLFGAVIRQRVARTKDLQKFLQDSASGVWTAVWADTMGMLGNLSVEFLNQAYGPIKSLLEVLPPAALANAVEAMLKAGNEKRKKQDRQPGDDDLEILSYEALLRLAKSEKPELAKKLILRTVIDRPDASSWHRRLLTRQYLNHISASDANEMLLAFATEIGEKMEEQSYIKVGEAQTTQSAPPQSLVKVTTVKYLAQILDRAEFIAPGAALELLLELFKVATHPDIRLATLESLTSLLSTFYCGRTDENWRSNPSIEKILSALEIIVPIAGSVDERRPPRAEDWEEAKKSGVIPNISTTNAGVQSLLSVVLTAPRAPGLVDFQAEFAARLLLPVIQHSQVGHRKWIALFLAKHKANFTVDDLPSTPITPVLWTRPIEQYPNFLPYTVLEDFNKYFVMTMTPPATVKKFNLSLKKNADICNNNDVQHWLYVFDRKMVRLPDSTTRDLVRMIHHDWPRTSVLNGITFQNVLDIVIEHASLFLDEYANFPNLWNDFVYDLRHPSRKTYSCEKEDKLKSMVSTWQSTGKLVLEKAVELVINRKKKYEQENNRSILPSIPRLRLWLLPYPFFPEPTTASFNEQCESFVRGIEEVLTDAFLQDETSVLRWSKLAEDACSISVLLNTVEERQYVASIVGKLKDLKGGLMSQKESALNLVRITLAMKLIEEDGGVGLKDVGTGGPEHRKYLVRRIRETVETWNDHFDESVREKVADWRRERADLWELLCNEEEK